MNKILADPFQVTTKPLKEYFMNWKDMAPKPYDKLKTAPYTKVRLILMNGTEFEANWFLHQFARHTQDMDLKRELAVVRSQEQQQQKRLSHLKPVDENILETTIAYEQLAVDLTAILSKRETNETNKQALNFALLEDFDHLYRFSNLLKTDYDIDADMLVGKFTEITPARPTIAEHRFAADNVKPSMCLNSSDPFSALTANIITAAEQQTMNYYMNVGAFYPNEEGRKLYAEIAMVEEEHVTQYESLLDPNLTWLENWVLHEYTEAYLYYSMALDESDPNIKSIYESHYEMEAAHLKKAVECLKKYENKTPESLLKVTRFPEPLKFGSNKEFIRRVLERTSELTAEKDGYILVDHLDENSDFAAYQRMINGDPESVPSHAVIKRTIKKFGEDYRYEDSPNPVAALRPRDRDNTTLGRVVK